MSRSYGLLIAGALALGLAGCGGSDDTGGAAAGGAAATTVALRAIDGTGDALVDSRGHTLYMTDQDSATRIACDNQACTSLWKPLTVADGQKPTGPDDIASKLSTVKRPDGTSQVAFDGMPLYNFTQDKGPGDASGNGVSDSFGGPTLTWHAVTPSGAAPAQPQSTSPDDNGGYGY
jgi:predicted lipoprotein with Yx(FWY)xxD motif